ncbi:hypothetical protein [Cellulomonas hominis]
MKTTLRAFTAAAAAAVISLGLALPAGAVSVTAKVDSASCVYQHTGGSNYSKSANQSCYRVGASIFYRDNSGATRTVSAPQSTTVATATSATTMVTSRYGHASIRIGSAEKFSSSHAI